VPFLRLTRDRRGFENTFLMHADRPGDPPRLLYWYRTAPGIALGRGALDEDAIRTIEEQHPDIDFDWPAILALSEVMTPEDEAAPKPQQKQKRRPDSARQQPRELRRGDRAAEPERAGGTDEEDEVVEQPADAPASEPAPSAAAPAAAPVAQRVHGLVDQLAGREIAARLRSRYDEMSARVREADASVRESLIKRAEALDPDRWQTPEDVLQGVSNADAIYEQLRAQLLSSRD
jgi:hypothetical protein